MGTKTPTPAERGPENFTKQGSGPIVAGVIEGSLRSCVVKLLRQNPKFRREYTAAVRDVTAAGKPGKRTFPREQVALFMGWGGRFGILSPNQAGATDVEQRMHESDLLADLKGLGYMKASPLLGEWGDVPAGSVLVQNMRPEDLFALGRKYGQESVIYKPKDGILGIYHLSGEPRADIVMEPEGDPILRAQADETLFTKSRGIELDHGYLWGDAIPWAGRTPITRGEVRRMLKRRDLEEVGSKGAPLQSPWK